MRLVWAVIPLVLIAVLFSVLIIPSSASAQYVGNLTSIEKTLEDAKRLDYINENFEEIFGYPKCDITNFFDFESFEGCFNSFSLGNPFDNYFWIVLIILSSLVVGIFFIKSKSRKECNS